MPLVKIKMKGPKPNSHTKITKISPPLPVTQNTQISQHVHQYYRHGLRVRPDILVSIYGRVLSSKLNFRKPEKPSEGEG